MGQTRGDDQAPPLGGRTAPRKRSVVIAGHRTSVSVEEPFWQALREIARERGIPLARLVAEIDRDREGNLSSAIRLYVLNRLRARKG